MDYSENRSNELPSKQVEWTTQQTVEMNYLENNSNELLRKQVEWTT